MDRMTSELDRGLGGARAYLASPEGRRLRKVVATGLIVAAPLIIRLPAFRASKIGRLVGLAGGATLIAAGARWLRDWEPEIV